MVTKLPFSPSSAGFKWPLFSTRIILFLVCIYSLLLSFWWIQPGHNWGGDFAKYTEQAESIINGSFDELFLVSKFSKDNSFGLNSPYLYSNGFPFLLVPIIQLFGRDFIAMKMLCAFFLAASAPVVYNLFKKHFSDNFFPAVIAIIVVVHPNTIFYTDNVLSDLPFMFFSLLSIYIMQQRITMQSQVLLGLCVFYSYFIREQGLSLIITLAAFQFFQRDKIGNGKLLLVLPYFVFLVAYVLTKWMFPMDKAAYTVAFSISQTATNISYYFDFFSSYFTLIDIPIPVGALFVVLVVIGMYIQRNLTPHLIVYVVVNLAVLCLFTYKKERYALFIEPVVVFFMVKGFIASFQFFSWVRILKYSLGVYLLFVLITGAVITSYRALNVDTNSSYNTEMRDVYSFIDANVDADAIIAFRKPGVLRLYTNRQSIMAEPKYFENSIAKYLLIRKFRKNEEFISGYQLIFETKNYALISK